jgi:hypothetical protein
MKAVACKKPEGFEMARVESANEHAVEMILVLMASYLLPYRLNAMTLSEAMSRAWQRLLMVMEPKTNKRIYLICWIYYENLLRLLPLWEILRKENSNKGSERINKNLTMSLFRFTKEADFCITLN